ncbi:MAG: hypothetical protein CL681_16920 [Blastopirellula sp.]|nr:hypothetical protein [Blastopirellula sp.]
MIDTPGPQQSGNPYKLLYGLLAIFVWPILCTLACQSLDAAEPSNSPASDPKVTAYLQQYCYRCHGETTRKGDRRFDQLPSQPTAGSAAATLLEEALGALNRGEMPPQKKGVKQPSAEETRVVIARITQQLAQLSRSEQATATVMRRLNRFEYANTLRDLLGLHTEFFDPTADFPVDANEHGFDNIGEALTLSDHQLQRYVEMAEACIERISYFDVQQPKSQTWRFTAKDFNGVNSYQRAPVTWRLIVNNDYLEIGHGQPSERAPNYVKTFARKGGVPANGWYTVSVRASAANRLDHGYDHREFDKYRYQPLKMALWLAPNSELLAKNAADRRQLIEVWDLPDDQPKTFTRRLWLEAGSIPFVSWTNGVSSKGNIRRVAEKHHPEVIRATKTQIDAAQLGDAEAQALVAKLQKNVNNKLLSEVYHGPRIRVWGLDIQGPTFPEWPPASHRLVFGDETDASQLDIEQTVLRFATRAFRQPLKLDDVRHYADYIRARIQNGDAPARAIQLGLAAILTSPRFLYLDEGNEEQGKRLEQYELASRLSYFLWSSLPDRQLLEAAEAGKLDDPDVLAAQVDRMLGDAKAAEFVQHFTDTWLRLNTLGSMPPDLKTFQAYYANRLESMFQQETRLFFADLLERNASILNLVDSKYTFANDVLAHHYGISGVSGEHFRRVTLQPKHHRGGLLGQGSVLTLTANGIETSPVVRGIWVLENLLGTPPPPPPPDVAALEPDTRGTTTIREQLAKHRNVTACADCHSKIDPAGFALEFYDPIGGYRTRYPARQGPGVPIDGSGQLSTGETFDDEQGFKQWLLARQQRFTETLAEKLLTYATGRAMTFQDQPEIKRIANQCEAKGHGLRDLVIGVATSNTFRNR